MSNSVLNLYRAAALNAYIIRGIDTDSAVSMAKIAAWQMYNSTDDEEFSNGTEV